MRNLPQSKKQTKKVQDIFGGNVKVPVGMPSRVTASSTVRLSKCVLKYALAVADPFNPLCWGACIPSGEVPSSQKAHASLHFEGAIGTQGIGFIIISPCLANDLLSGWVTNAAFSGTNTQILSANNTLVGGLSPIVVSNLPYTSAQIIGGSNILQPSIVGKMVALGVRVSYTGTTLNESGMSYAYVDPSHASVAGMGVSNLGSMNQVDIRSFTRRPIELVISAINSDELEMAYENDLTSSTGTGVTYPYSGNIIQFATTYQGGTTYSYANSNAASTNVGVPVALVILTGVAGQTFHVDMMVHTEFAGIGAQSMLSENPADTQGSKIVMDAAGRLLQSKMSSQKTGWSAMYDELANLSAELAPVVVPKAMSALNAILG